MKFEALVLMLIFFAIGVLCYRWKNAASYKRGEARARKVRQMGLITASPGSARLLSMLMCFSAALAFLLIGIGIPADPVRVVLGTMLAVMGLLIFFFGSFAVFGIIYVLRMIWAKRHERAFHENAFDRLALRASNASSSFLFGEEQKQEVGNGTRRRRQ